MLKEKLSNNRNINRKNPPLAPVPASICGCIHAPSIWTQECEAHFHLLRVGFGTLGSAAWLPHTKTVLEVFHESV